MVSLVWSVLTEFSLENTSGRARVVAWMIAYVLNFSFMRSPVQPLNLRYRLSVKYHGCMLSFRFGSGLALGPMGVYWLSGWSRFSQAAELGSPERVVKALLNG